MCRVQFMLLSVPKRAAFHGQMRLLLYQAGICQGYVGIYVVSEFRGTVPNGLFCADVLRYQQDSFSRLFVPKTLRPHDGTVFVL